MTDRTMILDPKVTRRYLLGRMAEAERDELEMRLLAEDEAYEDVLATEDELIDEYLAGALPAADRRAFEERLLPHVRIRERVAHVRRLRTLAAEAAAGEAVRTRGAGAPWGERVAAALGLGGLSTPPAFATAMAAALVLLVGVGGWLGWRAAELSSRVESLQARAAVAESALDEQRRAAPEVAAPASEAPPEPAAEGVEAPQAVPGAGPAAEDATAAELARERERAERLAERVEELERRPAPRPRVTAAFILSLATRSSSGVREIAVPADADTVRLQLDTGAVTTGSLRARLLAAGGRVAWSGSELSAGTDGSLVVAELPAELLTPGRYELLLEETPAEGGEPELIGAYEFHVR